MKDNAPDDVLDEYLVIRSQGGDPEAFQLLVERWHFRFIRHAFRYTKSEDAARDVVQDTWMAMIRSLSALNDPRRFRTWSYRIVANKARDWVRREQVRRRTDANPPPPDTVDSARSDDDITTIREGIQQLEPDQRLVLTWFYLEGMSVREIADALSIPIGTVKSRLFNARNTLRARLMEKR
jgi:RNA polymerase sigma factor (sigma-70 family)